MKIQHSILIAIVPFLWIGCAEKLPSPPEESAQDSTDTTPLNQQNPQLAAVLQDQAQKQSTALYKASVKVNGAWNYTGFSFLSPDPNAPVPARLVAVDITVLNHNSYFDVDDIEVVDGVTNFSYGSDPHFAFLDVESGELLPGDKSPAAAPKANRILLIYGFPVDTVSVKLAYWSKIITKQATTIKPSGWEIPHPPGAE